MFDYLEKLRQKPKSTRKFIAFCASFAFTGIVFVFWVVVMMPSIWSDRTASLRASQNEPSPISSLSQIFSDGSRAINTDSSTSTKYSTTNNQEMVDTSQ